MEYRKYQNYACTVDPDQDDRATQIRMFNFSRPHMRAFHCNWFGFFMAFCIWYAIAPLLSEIKKTLKLTKEEIWTSSIVAVSGTIFMRFLLGPLCDKFGPRVLFCGILCLASIPTAMTGVINSATGLAVLRLFIGIAGGTFVMCQYWTSRMFAREIVGTANALVGGWGNLGGGVIQLIVGTGLFPLFKKLNGGSAEKAWRTVTIVPAAVAFITGVVVYLISDDAPKGNYGEMKKNGIMPPVSAAASFRSGMLNINSWLLFVQYGCTFGVELTMNNAAALYFKDQFGQTTENAAAIASIFGWFNIFARALGGFLSDKFNARLGMRGRLLIQTIIIVVEGAMVLVFANTDTLGSAIAVMCIFAIFAEAGCGSTYGIVPYVDPPCTGSVSGIVGAGGNMGAVGFGLAFRQLPYKDAFVIMGCTILGSSVLSAFVFIKGSSRLVFGGEDVHAKTPVLEVPAVVDGSKNIDDKDDDMEHDA